MQSFLISASDAQLRLFRRDLRIIERALARGPCGESVLGCCGVGLAQCHALLAISDGGSALSLLAAELDIEASTLTRTLDSLERLGLIERNSAPGDRRAVVVTKTVAGEAKLHEIDSSWNGWFRGTLATMSAENRRAAVKGIAALASTFRSRSCCSKKSPSRRKHEIRAPAPR
jgi:DNA-binding MarR family transcriptional regulator